MYLRTKTKLRRPSKTLTLSPLTNLNKTAYYTFSSSKFQNVHRNHPNQNRPTSRITLGFDSRTPRNLPITSRYTLCSRLLPLSTRIHLRSHTLHFTRCNQYSTHHSSIQLQGLTRIHHLSYSTIREIHHRTRSQNGRWEQLWSNGTNDSR